MFFFVSPPSLKFMPEFDGMIVARFTFKPEHAPDFVEQDGQLLVETLWNDVQELIEFCEGCEEAIEECTVLLNGSMVSLKEVSR